jgi:hypothetical protein
VTSDLTFRAIEQDLGIADEQIRAEGSLGRWYQSVRDKRIHDFSIEDLCKACRQELYVQFVVPVAVQRLRQDPLCGEKYDGELVAALRSVPRQYWLANTGQAQDVSTILEAIGDTEDGELNEDIRRLLRHVAC